MMAGLAGKTALVTGSTDGLGKAVASKLAELGATVLVHGRNAARGAELADRINKTTPGRARFYRADLGSLAEVRALADAIAQDHEHLHLLINNAGIGGANADGKQGREASADGHELRFAVNYLSSYLLTRLMIPRLVAGSPSHIVNVSSRSQAPIEFDDVMLERAYDGGRAYARSKLAQIMFTGDLAAELAAQNIAVHALHPASCMDTTMIRRVGVDPNSTIEEGAAAVMHVVKLPSPNASSGSFFDGTREARAHPCAYDAESRRRLRELSERLVAPYVAARVSSRPTVRIAAPAID